MQPFLYSTGCVMGPRHDINPYRQWNGHEMNTPGMLERLLVKLGDRLRAAQAHRHRQALAAARLRAFSVLPTRPGRLLRF
jgi:hypothetical protein